VTRIEVGELTTRHTNADCIPPPGACFRKLQPDSSGLFTCFHKRTFLKNRMDDLDTLIADVSAGKTRRGNYQVCHFSLRLVTKGATRRFFWLCGFDGHARHLPDLNDPARTLCRACWCLWAILADLSDGAVLRILKHSPGCSSARGGLRVVPFPQPTGKRKAVRLGTAGVLQGGIGSASLPGRKDQVTHNATFEAIEEPVLLGRRLRFIKKKESHVEASPLERNSDVAKYSFLRLLIHSSRHRT
jgi:hypothetical protein